MLVYMFWYLRNHRSKLTNLSDIQFLLNYAFFSKTDGESCLWKYENSNMKVYYMNYNLRYNIILKLHSPLYMFLVKWLTSKRTFPERSIPELEDYLFYFLLVGINEFLKNDLSSIIFLQLQIWHKSLKSNAQLSDC